MKKSFDYYFLLITIPILICSCISTNKTKSPYDYVNPFIGTGGHGHTYPGATMPFGMVQLSPDTRLDGWDGCSGYHDSDSIIYGFSHTHLSGTGVSDYGDLLLMPFQSNETPTYQQLQNHAITPSLFSKNSEVAKPGFYAVELKDVKVELTSTEHVGIHHYRFNNSGKNKVLLDLNHRDKVIDFSISTNHKRITGHRISEAWATEQHIYFAMDFSAPFTIERPLNQDSLPDYYRILNFAKPGALMVKVGISFTSIEGAIQNLNTEAPHWDFDQYKSKAKQKWEKALSRIEISDRNQDKLSIFYTALYHTMVVPNIISDVNGQYRGIDQKIHVSKGKNQYTVFSLWDTFRGAHPLYTIIEQEKTKAFIQSFLNLYQQGGRLPVWELAANETDCMIGYHAVPVIVDAFFKGYQNFDKELALEAMLYSAELNHLGLKAYKNKGYIAAGDEAESVSKTLEYAYDDWCIAQYAKAIGHDSIYEKFIDRAQNYKNLFNRKNGFFQAKLNGGFTKSFNPAEVNFNYTEANAWQYSLFVPQDIKGLIDLYGNDSIFENHLDELFATEMTLSGRHQVDITGLIGQYAHGNEPSHHMAYLYNYIGKPYKTQNKINQILNEQYQNAPDGLSGNEDCGQMSAWYVLSSMGLYSVTPGLNYYAIGTPHFPQAKINLENGKTFIFKANNLSDKHYYIQSARLNGLDHNDAFIKHDVILAGGELVFEMGPEPNPKWGNNSLTSSIPKPDLSCPVPYFETASETFTDSLSITIKSFCEDCEIFYAFDDDFKKYTGAFTILEDRKIITFLKCNQKKSKTVQAHYKKIKGGRSLVLHSKYSNQYAASGQNALIDHLRGSPNFRTGYWQGYQGQDIELVMDLGKLDLINSVSVGALQDIKSWIWYPTKIEIWTSKFGKGYQSYGHINNSFGRDGYGAFTKDFTIHKKAKVQFIKVKLTYPGDCPDWHLGAGGKAWVFLDEIVVN